MPTTILDNGKVEAEVIKSSTWHLWCSLRYSPEVREDAFGVFSNVLAHVPIERHEVNRGDIRRLLSQLKPLVSRKFSPRDPRQGFTNILEMTLSNRRSINGDSGRNLLRLSFFSNDRRELHVDIDLDPTLTDRQLGDLMTGVKRAFENYVGSCNAFQE